MADKDTTNETPPAADTTAETEAIPAAEEPTTDAPETENATAAVAVPVATEPRSRRTLDTRSVIVTAAAIAALAASFGVGYAVGDHDGGGDRRERGRFGHVDGRGATGGRGDGPGMRGERGGGFDRGFDGPRGMGGGAQDGRGFRGPGGIGRGDVVMGTITKLDGDTLTIDPLGDGDDTTITLSDDVRVIKRDADGRADGARSDLDTGALVVTRDSDGDDEDGPVDTIVVLQAP